MITFNTQKLFFSFFFTCPAASPPPVLCLFVWLPVLVHVWRFQDATFLPLDDILEGKHIDIEAPVGRTRDRRRSSIAPNDIFHRGMHSHGYGDDRGDGDGGLSGCVDVPDITRPPMFLMEQDYGNSFKMSTCAPQQQVGR